MMKLLITTVLSLALVSVSLSASRKRAPLLAADSPTAIDGEYIVVFKDGVTEDQAETHRNKVQGMLNGTNSKIEYVYHIDKFMGYAALLDANELESVLSMDDVLFVERSQEVKALETCDTQSGAEWGLVRTTQRNSISNDYNYEYDVDGSGEGVTAYIIDTGIYIEHTDFTGRASYGFTFDGKNGDGNGHGTHVAGTVMGDKYGLAKKATAIAVRVLGDGGSGTTAGVIQGVQYVASHSSGKKSVANMSLGGGKSTALESAVNQAVAAGVHFAVAAGNEYGDACLKSPAGAKDCVTVGATDIGDSKAAFSNYGKCVDIFAPGVNVKAPWINSKTATNTISGTSMASPHVAGVMAKMLSVKDYTAQELKDRILEIATPDKVSNPGSGSPNKLLFKDCSMSDI